MMKIQMIKKAIYVLAIVPLLAFANVEVHLDKAPIDPSDPASLQRGARTFVNNCLNCHSCLLYTSQCGGNSKANAHRAAAT